MPSPRRCAFTLVETLVAIVIASMASSVLLLGIYGSVKVTDDALNETVANGLAQQLMDEVLGCRYIEYGTSAYETTLGPTAYEATPGTRERYDDMADFNNFRAGPPVDTWGVRVGREDTAGRQRHAALQAPSTFFDRWQQEIRVYYVSETNLGTPLAAGQTSDRRAVEVRILYVDPQRGTRELAKLRQIVTYVPPL